MLEIDREQALAYRVAGHNLHEQTDGLSAVAACGVQEYPPGWSAVALAARAQGPPDPDDVVTVNAMRGSPYVVPRTDVAVFTTALVPEDEAGLKALVGGSVAAEAAEAGYGVREALDLVAQAARDGLADGPLGRDDFHQAMRERLPKGLLPWCRGCESHHVRPGFWRALGPHGVTRMQGKAVWALAEEPSPGVEEPRKELARRFLRCYGPGTHSHLAKWAQTAPAHAKALFASIDDELEPVRVDGRKGFVLAGERSRVEQPPSASGTRMLGGYDPWVAQADREVIAPDVQLRKEMFPSVGRPGVVLVDGVLSALWRSRKKGRALEIEVEWLGEEAAELADHASAVATARDCSSVTVRTV